MSEQEEPEQAERELLAAKKRVNDAIDAGVAFAGLRDTQRGFVVQYLYVDPVEWMSCCGSYCDPCVQTIGRAVQKTRELLGLPWP